MIKETVYGPPGTGKTTYLLNRLLEILETVNSRNIGYVSFTRKGTYEGVQRAIRQFRLNKNELPYFKTIHALCFKEMAADRGDMVSQQHYRLLSKMTGIKFTGYYTEDFSSNDDEYLHVLSMSKHNPKFASKMALYLNAKKYRYVKLQYEEMKKQLGLIDFDDLLLQYLEKGKPLNVKSAFIDEAQDLTPLQWKVVRKMFAKSERIIVAGDDDQAVYEWSGADVTKFLRFSKNSKVLQKSYRLPESALKLAKNVSKDIFRRKTKNFTSNGEKGEIHTRGAMNHIAFNGGELVLARTNHILKKLSVYLAEKGYPFRIKNKISYDKFALKAVKAYKSLYEGDFTKEDLTKYASFYSTIDLRTPWHAAIKLKKHEIAYYDKLVTNRFDQMSPINLETFHSSKGSENAHVILATDISQRVAAEFEKHRDSELRCLYVGITRTKNKLTILNPIGNNAYPGKYFN